MNKTLTETRVSQLTDAEREFVIDSIYDALAEIELCEDISQGVEDKLKQTLLILNE